MIYTYESRTQSWEYRWKLIKFWLPPLTTGLLTLLVLLLAQTPPIRAAGLAFVIVGLTASLRRMGSLIAVTGGLMLTFSPAFWSQSGGTEGSDLTIVVGLIAAALSLLILLLLSRQFYVSLAIGLIIFVVIFFSQVATPRSLRLTALVIGWLMYLLNDMLLLTNPRPDEAPLLLLDRNRDGKRADGSTSAKLHHTWGILLLFAVGCLNDPIMVLLAPALLLAIYLTQTRLPILYWILFGITIGLGLYGFRDVYLTDLHWYLRLTEWRDAARWIDVLAIMANQFTVLGLFLGALGLARLTRWYPPIGTVTLVGYAAFWLFGVVYVGPDRSLLLLPLFAIHVFWMTYAVLAISTWAQRATSQPWARFVVLLAYALLPFSLAWQAFFA